MADIKDQNEKRGALWLKESKSGQKYLNGYITVEGEKILITAFKNDKYEEEGNKPYYNLVVNEPRGDEEKPANIPVVKDEELPF